MKLGKGWRLVSLLAILIVIGVVSATVLFQQRQPAVPVAGQITPNCGASTVPTPVNVTLGSSGQVTFSCDSTTPTTRPAFTTGGPVLAIPLITGFVAPYNTTRLFIYTASGAPTGVCSGRLGALKIENGVAELMPANGWNYCAEYEIVGPTGLPEFTVQWTY